MGVKTVNDLTLINNQNAVDFGITNVATLAPVLNVFSAIPASAYNSHSYRRLTGEATGGFRDLNDGVAHSAATYEQIDEVLKIYDATTAPIDSAWLKMQKSPIVEVNKEIASSTRTMYKNVETQLFAGGDAKGFTSLVSRFGALSNDRVMTAGGTGSNLTSIWLIYSADDQHGLSLVVGANQSVNFEEPRYGQFPGSTTGFFNGFVVPGTGLFGVQLGSKLAALRIANIDLSAAPNAAHAATGKLIYQALATKFPLMKPNMIVMRDDTLEQIRAGRTATSPTGADAETPDVLSKIPVYTTSNISAAETVVS